MTNNSNSPFRRLVKRLPEIGMEWHRDTLIENTERNTPLIGASLRAIKPSDKPVLLVCAGPSLYRNDSLKWVYNQRYKVTIVATDGAYIRCLRKGVIPDYVLTLDPHPTRIVRWFGDPEIEQHMTGDDYFARQDLDIDFRREMLTINAQNIRMVDLQPTSLVIGCASPANVVERTTGWDRYWFAPLVDDPTQPGLTRKMMDMTGLPAMNTGGTVGNACWVFAYAFLKAANIACVGMDFGYPPGTPLQRTQSWNMLKHKDGVQDYYPECDGVDGRKWFSDPTYTFYREALLSLMDGEPMTNCTEGGTLIAPNIKSMGLDAWLKSLS